MLSVGPLSVQVDAKVFQGDGDSSVVRAPDS